MGPSDVVICEGFLDTTIGIELTSEDVRRRCGNWTRHDRKSRNIKLAIW